MADSQKTRYTINKPNRSAISLAKKSANIKLIDMAKLYKEQTQLGYSKMLPQIALGQSQSSILATAYFENDVLELFNVFIPPLMSSTMNADALKTNQNAASQNNGSEKEGAGRKELADDEKSEKTIANRESMN